MIEELVYAGKEVEDIITSKYPNAKITDASDCIHAERFEVEITDLEDDEFYPLAIKEGFATLCFSFQLLLQSLKFPEHKEAKEKLNKWIGLAKP